MIDLCVVSHNNQEQLPRLINTLAMSQLQYPFVDWTLRIADNGSTDRTGDILRSLPEDQTMINAVLFNKNIGYARACNQLARLGTSEIIGLLNADVWFTTEDLQMVEEQFFFHPEMGVLGPKQRDENGNITHAGIFGTNEAPRHRGWKEHDSDDERYRDRLPAVTVSGAAYFVRRSVWDELTNCPIYREVYPEAQGAFLPTQHYYEETWCSYHAHAHGSDVIYDGSISIGHTWHASSDVGSPTDHLFRESQILFRHMCGSHGIKCD